MTDPTRRPRALTAVAAVTALFATILLGGCAPAPAPAFDASSLDRYRSEDGLLHDHDVRGLDGAVLAEGGLDEGLWTTAAAVRLLQTQGIEPRLDADTAARIDHVAEAASVTTHAPHRLLGAARVCALSSRDSDGCRAAVSAATRLLGEPDADVLDTADPVSLIETASDLGVLDGVPGTPLHRALARETDDDCVRSAVIRHLVRFDRLGERRTVADPRALADAVLAALRRGDVDEALCRSGLAAAAAGATPERDEDWLQEPFDAAVSAGFVRSSGGWYRSRASGRGAVDVTRMLSQVSFDLSVELT
ncbi:hypothetical protein [Microbacterium sp. PA5]|uniref:hypothetical protein n=1 Tax=Microbacterium sp. PA5 TaxID=3416654 RepID=UPI003CF63083